ncbi:MAG: accessory gene regulator B family protein [Clostridia bacterium]|nr:accessory gene regulator B family protein [Clostridia bacterium]
MKNSENAEDLQYREVYQYVLFLILNYLLFFGYSLILGTLLGVPFQSLVFFVCIAILRRYAGGYHANTEKRCLIISSVYFLTGIILIKIMNLYADSINFNIILSISVICSLIILFLCPCDSPSKPVAKEKRKGIRIKCITIIVMIFTAMLSLLRFNKPQFMSLFFSAFIIETVLIIAGKIKTKTTCHIEQ